MVRRNLSRHASATRTSRCVRYYASLTANTRLRCDCHDGHWRSRSRACRSIMRTQCRSYCKHPFMRSRSSSCPSSAVVLDPGMRNREAVTRWEVCLFGPVVCARYSLDRNASAEACNASGEPLRRRTSRRPVHFCPWVPALAVVQNGRSAISCMQPPV